MEVKVGANSNKDDDSHGAINQLIDLLQNQRFHDGPFGGFSKNFDHHYGITPDRRKVTHRVLVGFISGKNKHIHIDLVSQGILKMEIPYF